MTRLFWFASVTILSVISAPALAAPNTGNWGRSTTMSVGWNDPNTRVVLNIPMFNPEGCATPDGYMVDSATPGAALFASTILTAYSQRQQLRLTVDGCFIGRPKIIGIEMQP